MREADLHSSCLALFLTSLQCFLLCVCFTCPILPLQYVTFVLQVLNSGFFYGGHHAFVCIAYVHTSFLIPPHFRANSKVRKLGSVILLIQTLRSSLACGSSNGNQVRKLGSLVLLIQTRNRTGNNNCMKINPLGTFPSGPTWQSVLPCGNHSDYEAGVL